jgi:DedD protein
MAKQQSEDELNLKRKARRRLIGAVALTLAVVVILPMVLDNEPKPSGKDIDLSIPAPDKVGEFVTHRVSEAAVTLPAEASSVIANPVSGTTAPAVLNTPTLAETATPSAAPSPSQEGVPNKAKASLESSPHKSAASQKSAGSSQSTEVRNAEQVTESYVAQVGAYSKSETAKQELNKLKKWGFKAYIEKSGDKVRVRVGPYADRAKAEKAAHQLEKHGLHPVIITAK